MGELKPWPPSAAHHHGFMRNGILWIGEDHNIPVGYVDDLIGDRGRRVGALSDQRTDEWMAWYQAHEELKGHSCSRRAPFALWGCFLTFMAEVLALAVEEGVDTSIVTGQPLLAPTDPPAPDDGAPAPPDDRSDLVAMGTWVADCLDETDHLVWRTVVRNLVDEVERHRILLDADLTFRDLELKIRDDSVSLRGISDVDGGDAKVRWFAALLFHMFLGDDDTEPEPPNYRSFEFELSPAGGFETIRLAAEIIKPGGKSSHQIRRDLEARLAELEPGP